MVDFFDLGDRISVRISVKRRPMRCEPFALEWLTSRWLLEESGVLYGETDLVTEMKG